MARVSERDPVKVGEDALVTLVFTLKDAQGNLIDDTHQHTPVKFIFGSGKFPAGFEEGILGLLPGDEARISVPALKGYGKKRKDLYLKVRQSELPDDFPQVGGLYRVLSTQGKSEAYTVRGFTGGWVTLDKNHPLAGKDLEYAVRIMDVSQVRQEDRDLYE